MLAQLNDAIRKFSGDTYNPHGYVFSVHIQCVIINESRYSQIYYLRECWHDDQSPTRSLFYRLNVTYTHAEIYDTNIRFTEHQHITTHYYILSQAHIDIYNLFKKRYLLN